MLTRRRGMGLAAAGIAFAGVLWFSVGHANAGEEEVDVVVNKSNSVNTLSLDEAKSIFRCEKTVWPGGKHIKVTMLAPSEPERGVVLREVYKMSEGDYAKYFLEATFVGKIQAPPKDFDSSARLKQFVATNPGAIGYVRKSSVDDSVKVVLRLP